MENPHEKIAEAMLIISAVEQDIYTTGAVDSEKDQIQNLRDLLQNGEITPDEAIVRVRALEGTRSTHYR